MLGITPGVAAAVRLGAKSVCPKTMFLVQGDQKSLCEPDDYNTVVRCTETFSSPCIIAIGKEGPRLKRNTVYSRI